MRRSFQSVSQTVSQSVSRKVKIVNFSMIKRYLGLGHHAPDQHAEGGVEQAVLEHNDGTAAEEVGRSSDCKSLTELCHSTSLPSSHACVCVNVCVCVCECVCVCVCVLEVCYSER